MDVVARLLGGEVIEIPSIAAIALLVLAEQVRNVQSQIRKLEKELLKWFRGNEVAQRLATIPGIGYITATAMAASVTEPQQFSSGRQFSAWLGITPLQNSSGGKERLGRISKMGDQYLRRLLVTGMTARIGAAVRQPETADPWLVAMLARKPRKLVAVALANKTARIAWVVMARGESYRKPQPATQIAA